MYANKKQEQFMLNSRKLKAEKEKKKAVSTQKTNSTTKKATSETTAKINQQKLNYNLAADKNDYIEKRIANTEANKVREKAGLPLYSSAVGDKQASLTNAKTPNAIKQIPIQKATTSLRQTEPTLSPNHPLNREKKTVSPIPVKVLNDMFDKNENYVDKFKKGNIGGGVASLVGETIQLPQSGLMNISNNINSVAHSKGLQPYKRMMDYTDYENEIRDRNNVTPLSQAIGDKNKLLGNLVSSGMNIATDPLNLLDVGAVQTAKGLKTLGSAKYADNLANGEFVPVVLKSGKKVASTADLKDLKTSEKAEAVQAINNSRKKLATTTAKGNAKPLIQASNQAIQPQNIDLGTMVRQEVKTQPIPIRKPLAKSTEKTPSIEDKMKAIEAEHNRTVDVVYNYIKNYKPKGVDINLVPKSNEYGADEFFRQNASKNDLWYQDFYKENGRKPNVSEMRELAEKIVIRDLDDIHGEFHNADLADMINKLDEPQNNVIEPQTFNSGTKTPQRPFQSVGADLNKNPSKYKVSQLRSNTIENSDQFTNLKENMPQENFEYEVRPEKVTMAEAKQRLETDFEGEVDDLYFKTNFDGADTDTAMGIAKTYGEEATQTGNYTRLNNWSKQIQEKATEQGQAIQAFAKYTRTAEGKVIEGQKEVARVQRKISKTNPKLTDKIEQETRQITDTVKEAETEARKQTKSAAEKLFEKAIANKSIRSGSENPAAKAVSDITSPNGKELGEVYKVDSTKRLVNKIEGTFSTPKEKPPLQGVFDDLVSELSKIANESNLPKKTAVPKNPIATLSEAIKQKDLYGEVWERAKATLSAKYKGDEKASKLLSDYFENGIVPPYSQSTFNKSFDKAIKDLSIDIKGILLNNPEERDVAQWQIKNYLIKSTGATDYDAERLAYDVLNKFTDIANQKNFDLLENLIKERVKTAPLNAYKKLEQLVNIGAYNSDRYASATNIATEKAVRQSIKDFGLNIGDIIKRSKGEKESLLNEIRDYIIYSTDVKGEEAELLTKQIVDEYGKTLSNATASKLKTMFREVPKKGQKTTFQKVIELINMGAYDNQSIKDIIRAKNKIPVLENEDIKGIFENMKLSEKATDPYMKRMYEARAQQIISDKLPQDAVEKFKATQRIIMLPNPKTLITRNPVGNAILGTLEDVKNVPATALDKALSLKTGKRTTTIAPFTKGKESLKGGIQGVHEWAKDIINKVDTSSTGGQADLPHARNIFTTDHKINDPALKYMADTTGKVGNAIHAFTGHMLQLGDRPFYQGAYNSRIAELKKINKTDIVTDAMKEDANLHALERTLQNDSWIASKISRIGADKNDPIVYRVFANLVMPFKKTPGNILDKFIDYSGLGTVKAFGHVANVAKNGTEFNQKYFVDTMARGLTGFGLATLGYLMAEKGLVTGGYDPQNQMQQIDNQLGKNNFAFKIGDTYATFDWALPATAPIALGVQYYSDKENGVLSGLTGATNLLFKSTVLQGASNLMSGYNPAASIGKTLMGSTTQFTPTAGKQISQMVDPYIRETYDPNGFKQTLNKTVARIPFASKTLPIKQNAFGQDVKAYQGKNNAWNVMLNPSNVSQYKPTAMQLEISRLNKKSGYTDQLPDIASKSFTKNNEKYVLSAKDYANYQKAEGEYYTSNVSKLINSNSYKDMSDEERVKAIKRIKDSATVNARMQYFENNGKSPLLALDTSVQKKYAKVKDTGITDKQFIQTNKKLSGLSKQEEVQSALDSTKLTQSQKEALWYASNSSWTETSNPYKDKNSDFNFNLMSDSKKQKFLVVANKGVSKQQYANALGRADTDDNGSIKKDELKQAMIDAGFTSEQRRAMYISFNWKAE